MNIELEVNSDYVCARSRVKYERSEIVYEQVLELRQALRHVLL